MGRNWSESPMFGRQRVPWECTGFLKKHTNSPARLRRKNSQVARNPERQLTNLQLKPLVGWFLNEFPFEGFSGRPLKQRVYSWRLLVYRKMNWKELRSDFQARLPSEYFSNTNSENGFLPIHPPWLLYTNHKKVPGTQKVCDGWHLSL